jgi:cell division septal protein FtsQ
MRKRRLHNAPVIFLAIALVGVSGYFLGWSKALAIKTIEISAAGNEAIIQPLIVPNDLRVGLPIARVSVTRINKDLSHLTWIKDIKVNRRWLAHDVRVVVTERKAIAQYQDMQGVTEYFDSSGHHFTSPNPPSGIPTISFATENDNSRSTIAAFLAQIPSDLTANLVSLSEDKNNQIQLTTTITGFKALSISWGGADQLPLKVKVLRQLLTLPENKKITSVDLSAPLTPIVK